MLRFSSPMPDSAPRLARSAGVIGLATMTSRILGLVREQVLALLLRRRGCHGRVSRGVSSAELAARPLRRRRHERRLRADLHELSDPRRPRACLAAGQRRSERAHPGDARARRGGLCPRPHPRPAVRGGFRRGTGEARAHHFSGAHRPAISHARRRRRGIHGHAECARALLSPGAVSGHLQSGQHRAHRRPRAIRPHAGRDADRHRGGRHHPGRYRASRDSVADPRR